MPAIEVAIWKSTAASSQQFDWQDQDLATRLGYLERAVARVSAHFADPSVVRQPNRVWTIFAAPEYTLADRNKGKPIPAEHLPLADTSKMFNALEKLSRSYPEILIVPGSFAFKTETTAQNNAVGYFNGESVLFAGKKHGVGEATGTGLEFVPGDGVSTVTLGGLQFALQICKDATVADTLQQKVDIHITVGQGVGLDAIKTLAPRKARIVADPFCSGIYSYVDNANVATTATETYDGIGIAYYSVGL